MIVLGIETSCDDTSVCLLQKTQKETKILSHLRDSQEEFFSDWGGVVPELAARNHLKKITPLLIKFFENAKSDSRLFRTREPITFLRVQDMPQVVLTELYACMILHGLVCLPYVCSRGTDMRRSFRKYHSAAQHLDLDLTLKMVGYLSNDRTKTITPTAIRIITIDQNRSHGSKGNDLFDQGVSNTSISNSRILFGGILGALVRME